MARQRDYAAEYRARQERARARGFRDYYEQRTRVRPGAPKPSREQLAERRGHAGYEDLLRYLRARGEGALVGIDPVGSERAADGTWKVVRITVLAEDGSERTFTMRKVTDEKVQKLITVIHDAGAIDSPLYPVGKLESGGGGEGGLDAGEDVAA